MMHRWIGAGSQDRHALLSELGKNSIDELFDTIPEEVRAGVLAVPGPLDETTLLEKLGERARENRSPGTMPSFLGAGVYRHVVPAVIDSVLQRAEFFTSYTPYQPEISQGTLQTIFEYQTIISRLAGLDVANASLYDGTTATVEAALMAHRVFKGKRNRVVVSESVHPMYRRVLATYTSALGIEVVTVPAGTDGRTDVERLTQAAGSEACCIIVQSPNFLGVVEDLPAIASAAHQHSALAVQVVAEAASLGVLKGGGEHGFDIVCGEAQAYGIPAAFGGPHLGFFATSAKLVRQMPGRVVGQTVDAEGRRAFCLTLATREQHIRRAKATSNICSNHGLMLVAATVWLELLGGNGLFELGRANVARVTDLKRRIQALGQGWQLAYPDSPVFNELLVCGPAGGTELQEALLDRGVLAGVPSRLWGGSWPDGLLVAVTERTTNAEVDALIDAMENVS